MFRCWEFIVNSVSTFSLQNIFIHVKYFKFQVYLFFISPKVSGNNIKIKSVKIKSINITYVWALYIYILKQR